jgi:hypothetical protein
MNKDKVFVPFIDHLLNIMKKEPWILEELKASKTEDFC